RQRPVTDATQCIDIRPRSLPPPRRILLNRGIARTHDGGDRAALGTNRLPRRAKVDQYRRAIYANDDVPGLNITVQKVRLMHCLQTIENREQYPTDLRLAEFILAGQKLRK